LGVAEVRFVEPRAITLEEADNCLSLPWLGSYSYSYSYSYSNTESYTTSYISQCFLEGGGCDTCCPQCDVTTDYNNRYATKCVCSDGGTSGGPYDAFYGSDHDDCIFGDGSAAAYAGMGGDDVIVVGGEFQGVVVGDFLEDAFGGSENDGNDVITWVGDWATVLSGGGDDVITIRGDNAGADIPIYAGKGDDTIIIYGQGATVFGGDDQDSCAAGTNPVAVEGCEIDLGDYGDPGDPTAVLTGLPR
jgi:hypothetical protein